MTITLTECPSGDMNAIEEASATPSEIARGSTPNFWAALIPIGARIVTAATPLITCVSKTVKAPKRKVAQSLPFHLPFEEWNPRVRPLLRSSSMPHQEAAYRQRGTGFAIPWSDRHYP